MKLHEFTMSLVTDEDLSDEEIETLMPALDLWMDTLTKAKTLVVSHPRGGELWLRIESHE